MKALFAPWRLPYVKRASKEEDTGCVFCDGFQKGPSAETLLVGLGLSSGIFLNKYPYNNGHCMVIPRRHTAEFESLSAEEFNELHRLLKVTYEVLKISYNPQGMNIGMNLGRSGGAGITDHMHYHLVPRWNGDTNFMPVVAQDKVISESLEQTFARLRPLFKEQGF